MAKERVTLFEVGPRDGLQNEPVLVPFTDKVKFVRLLLDAGVKNLELGAFVRPDRVPQMADTDRIYAAVRRGSLDFGTGRAWCLVPNRIGLGRALASGARNIALFTAATDSFARRNISMSIRESLEEFAEIVKLARAWPSTIHVRGYVSTAFGCPFEGRVRPRQALRVIEGLKEIGVDEISVGDTIGVATPRQVEEVLKPAMRLVGARHVAGHFHDTRGTALANSLRAVELGIRTLDSSAGGLGGCPFAPGAAGNVATEDLVYMLEGMGFQTGIDLTKLAKASLWFAKKMKRPLRSRYVQSLSASRCF